MVLVDHFVTRRDGCDGAWIAEQAMKVSSFAMDDQHSYGLLTAATCRTALAPVIAGHEVALGTHRGYGCDGCLAGRIATAR